jgi:hypothetical protein
MEEVYNNYNDALKKADNLYEKIVSKYSIQSMAREHERIYESICS